MYGLGFRVYGLGFRVYGLGFKITPESYASNEIKLHLEVEINGVDQCRLSDIIYFLLSTLVHI